MRKDYDEMNEELSFGELLKKKMLLLISMASLVLNLLIFALAIKDIRVFSFVLAGVFLIYTAIEFFDKKIDRWTLPKRILEIVMALGVSVAFIVISTKYWLLVFPILEIALPILYYFLVHKKR